MVLEFHKNRQRLLAGQNPNRLLTQIRLQKKDLEEKERSLKDILPELKGLIDLSCGLPKIRFFEGKAGIKFIRDDIIKSKGLNCIEEFIPVDEAYRLFPPHKRDHRQKMVKMLNHTAPKMIYTSLNGRVLSNRNTIIERRFISPEKFPLSCEMNLYGDKVGIAVFKRKPVGVIIEAREIAESLRSIFYVLWNIPI